MFGRDATMKLKNAYAPAVYARSNARSVALKELWDIILDFPAVLRLAHLDMALRYRRTVLGPFWVTISTGLMIVAIGIVYGTIFGTQNGLGIGSYLHYFAAGTITWNYISSMLNESASVFIANRQLLKVLPTSPLTHLMRMVSRNLVILFHNAIFLVILWITLGCPLTVASWLVIPGLFLVVLTLVSWSILIAIVCTRYRDGGPLVASVLQLSFLITPVIWPTTALRSSKAWWILDINPFYHLIEIVRAPLLGDQPMLLNWAVAIVIAALSVLLAAKVYMDCRSKLIYWL